MGGGETRCLILETCQGYNMEYAVSDIISNTRSRTSHQSRHGAGPVHGARAPALDLRPRLQAPKLPSGLIALINLFSFFCFGFTYLTDAYEIEETAITN